MTQPLFPADLRLRAECSNDLNAALEMGQLVDNMPPFQDVDDDDCSAHFIIAGPEQLAGLLIALSNVEDGHRMFQTLDTAEHYTGEFVDGVEFRADRILALLGNYDPSARKTYLENVGISEGSPTP